MIETNELKNRFRQFSEDYGGNENAAKVVGLELKKIEEAFGGEEKSLKKLSDFFESRDYAFENYDDECRELLIKFEHLIVTEGSAGNAAAKIGKAPSTMSDVRKYKYKGRTAEVFKALNEYFTTKAERTKVFKSVEYAPTGISCNIYEAVRLTQIKGECSIITGDPGVGKTKTIKKYEADNPKSTVVITGEYFRTGVNSVLEMLAEALGVSDDKPSRLRKAVLSKLSDGMLIIVDEAQCFSFRALDSLRSLSDKFQDRGETLGVAYIGNHCLRDMFCGKYSESHSQLWSRFCAKPKYYSKQITVDDVKMMFPMLVEDNMLKELYFLHSIATTTREGLRTAVRLFSAAYDSGDYTLDSLVNWAHSFDVEIQNLPQIIKRIKKEASA